MKLYIANADIWRSETCEFIPGSLLAENGRIAAFDVPYDPSYGYIDAGGYALIPGFIDVHTHGCLGHDFVSADGDALEKMSVEYIKNGVTSLFPTLASAELDELLSAADRINAAKSKVTGASFAGIHLEGRYLNPKKRGAHAENLLVTPNADELERMVYRMCLPCHVTAALELDRDGSFAELALKLGATLGLGHTCATYSEAMTFYEKYGVSFSHLFNAMPPLGHRDSGAVCAGLTSGAFCELICDGIHISPEVIKMAYKCLGNKRLSLITDSMEATGCPDGEYSIAGNPCTVKNGVALTHEGNLAGSTLDMKTALENLMSFCGIKLSEAVRSATLTPAEEVGIDKDYGSLAPGKIADMLIVKEKCGKINILKTIKGGVPYES